MSDAKLPPIPATIMTILGPVSIEEGEAPDGSCGACSFTRRVIVLEPGMHPVSQWQTLWHEVAHFAVWDSGVDNIVNDEQREAICDVLGVLLTRMMLSGKLKVIP